VVSCSIARVPMDLPMVLDDGRYTQSGGVCIQVHGAFVAVKVAEIYLLHRDLQLVAWVTALALAGGDWLTALAPGGVTG
jgi:hypothetical protein